MASGFILTTIIFLPLVFAIIIFFLPKENIKGIKLVTLGGSILTFLISLFLFFGYDAAIGGFQFLHKFTWISNLNISSADNVPYTIGTSGFLEFR